MFVLKLFRLLICLYFLFASVNNKNVGALLFFNFIVGSCVRFLLIFSLISFVHLSLEMISYFHMVSQFMWIGSPEQALVTLVWLYLAVDTSLVRLQPAPPGGLVATLFTLQQLPLSMLLF